MLDITLHVGAHRTASTSFQCYLRANREALAQQQVGFWGPWRTRGGLLHGIAEPTGQAPLPGRQDRGSGRVQLALDGARRSGVQQLLVSDENMLGTPRRCARKGVLYPDAGERVARLCAAFGGVQRICLTIRSLNMWWASLFAYLVPRGEGLPTAAQLAQIATAPRSWRHVITDLSEACPQAEIRVMPFDAFSDRPDGLLRQMTDLPMVPPAPPGAFWKNRHLDLAALRAELAARGDDPAQLPAGSGRYMPFDAAQTAALREAYTDDLFWLTAGAEGRATLMTDPDPEPRGTDRAGVLTERGHSHDRQPEAFAPRLVQNR